MKPIPLSTNKNVFWKRGSTWRFLIRRGTLLQPIDITDCVPRSMFRIGSSQLDGQVILTLTSSVGLSIPTPMSGATEYLLIPLQTVLFPANEKVYFDLELTSLDGTVWQSPTYFLTAIEEGTRDV